VEVTANGREVLAILHRVEAEWLGPEEVRRPTLRGTCSRCTMIVVPIVAASGAAGAERVVIDIPVGPTAKVRSQAAAQSLSACPSPVDRP